MTYSVDLFWSFRSPYSYLATPRILAMEREWDVNVNVRPVFPIAIRNPGFFDSIHPLWIPYLLNDVQRVAKFYGMTFAWPSPDPIIMDMKTKVIAMNQPYIFRLTRLGVEAARRDAGLPFLNEVSGIIFSGKAEGWDQGDHLAQAARRAGLNLGEMESAVASREKEIDAQIEANQVALEAAGHWGVPTLVFDGEPFFGQDRIEVCLWRMREKGLGKRP